ncbi:MAG TPA: HAMP domain-containing sensor histidine kinase [Candidatus Limnocylindrales bacterium]|nr:HAMP domain-containing sensor histidine kinase [Candidatus Limnocylindrales bacterium]
MPASLTGRIVVAFGVLAVALWLAIGATMFVVLRGLHAEATSSALADIVQTFAVRLRGAVADREVRTVVNQIRGEVAGGVTIHLLAADGHVVDVGLPDPAPSIAIPIPPETRIGDTLTGTAPFADGQTHDYAALVLRGPNATAARAVLLSSVDHAGADALRDVGRTLPIVILVTLAIGAPLAFLLSRSIARPLARLARRTSELVVPGAPVGPPLPVGGPGEVRDATARVNVLAEELTRTRARESELLADLRHDLRTPLTVIAGYAAALADGTATGPAAERAAAAIAEEAGRLERLVGELGAIDRLRAGTDALRLEPIDADAVLAATVDRFASAARTAGVTLEAGPAAAASAGETGVAGPIGSSLAADRIALDRILGNLVDNALAVVEPGGSIRLEARRVHSVAGVDGPAIAFSVLDDGPGFAPGGTARAFERFYRGDPSRAGRGSGLGLSIVRELALAHGGTAIAENLSPHGARVSVVLPVQPPERGRGAFSPSD